MQDIKFRVWHKGLNRFLTSDEWVIGFNGELYFIELQEYNNNTYGKISNLIKCDNSLYSIQRYTGLQDIDGVLIYEGDIIQTYKKYDSFKYDYSFRMNYIENPDRKDKWDYIKTHEEIDKWEVSFSKQELCDEYSICCSGWMVHNLDKKYITQSLDDLISETQITKCQDYIIIKEASYRVIGNIFENPQLLNENK